MGKEIGIIMAARLGARMYPLTEHRPKPLVRVQGIPMIETVIGGLQSKGISEIHVVVRHLQEQFEYLTEKYRGIGLIRNPEYRQPGHGSLFEDEVVDRMPGPLSIGIHQVGRSQITEIDTVEELNRINGGYR